MILVGVPMNKDNTKDLNKPSKIKKFLSNEQCDK